MPMTMPRVLCGSLELVWWDLLLSDALWFRTVMRMGRREVLHLRNLTMKWFDDAMINFHFNLLSGLIGRKRAHYRWDAAYLASN